MKGNGISVIIPVYNAGRDLEACVRSVTEQGDPETEILLADDGSDAETVRAEEALCAADSRIRLLRGAHGGVSEARNRGLQAAGGTFIIFLDADDMLTAGALKALRAGCGEGIDACCGGVLRGTETGRNRGKTRTLRGTELINEALARPTDLLTIHGWIFRRRVFEEAGIAFNPALSIGEDSEMVIRYLRACRGAALIPEATYRYRIVADSIVHGWHPGQEAEYLRMLETIRGTEIREAENWPLFVLTTFLLMITHHLFHPANPAGRREQFAEVRQIRALPIMEEAFREADLGRTEAGKRFVLQNLKAGRIFPAWMAVRIRQGQNARLR